MGRPLNSGTVEKHPEKQRLGCKYADQYYAGQFNITQEEARNAYSCATGWKAEEVGAPICPFGFVGDCIIDMDPQFIKGVVAGLLNTKLVTCKLVLISYTNSPYVKQPDYIHYECSNCGKTIKGSVKFMEFCYRCGSRIT